MWMITWWHWLAVGLVLVALEVAMTSGFYMLFFGVAAIVISVLSLLGLAGPPWVQFLLFSVLSVVSLLFFRSPLLRWMKLDRASPDIDSLVGEEGVALDDIPPGELARVELRGTVWSARNSSAAALPKGHRCVVVRVDRLTLIVTPEGARS
jgi:membrane protein implicated in regulation of membrane protease activity